MRGREADGGWREGDKIKLENRKIGDLNRQILVTF